MDKMKAYIGNTVKKTNAQKVTGKFIKKAAETFYQINHVNQMNVFFMSIVSSSDHWLFVASNGALTAGRISPDKALFPYTTVDKLYDSAGKTGPKSLFYIHKEDKIYYWEPFCPLMASIYQIEQRLYKNIPGNKIIFEEYNKDLDITFSYLWTTSPCFGFIRKAKITNNSQAAIKIEVLDGVSNILPALIDQTTQSRISCLSDAYKQNELDFETNIGIYGLASQITDKAEPKEALRANIAWSTGLKISDYLISDDQLKNYQQGNTLKTEAIKKGKRGSYFIHSNFSLKISQSKEWYHIFDVHQSQNQIVQLKQQIQNANNIIQKIEDDIQFGTNELQKIIGSADGLQTGNDHLITSHHFSNVLYNCMRGGTFFNHYQIEKNDFIQFLKMRNINTYNHNEGLLLKLNSDFNKEDLTKVLEEVKDPDLYRLSLEYLPLFFSRRHGDPSRPWNKFAIHINDENNHKILNYQGNWRDIFQNWEALCLSYPAYIENIIAKFVNATTLDGYNPYRITRKGIEWEKIDPEDPWSNIGYWGDHQIIYLLKFLEWDNKFFPGSLSKYLCQDLFTYANIPYQIKPYEEILKNPYETILYDQKKNQAIDDLVSEMGSDGCLILTKDKKVYHVNLTEKLLILLLGKLVNFIPDGGIWMNTQRPEWNDANNALVGYGLSMVTLFYLRRYILFSQKLFEENLNQSISISQKIFFLFQKIYSIFQKFHSLIIKHNPDSHIRKKMIDELQTAGSDYRSKIYSQGFDTKTTLSFMNIVDFTKFILPFIDLTIERNKRQDGLYHSYNLIKINEHTADVLPLYEMLEGQVAALSAGVMNPDEAIQLLNSLRKSSLYREDQNSYFLYPNKELKNFLEKNTIPQEWVNRSSLLKELLQFPTNPIINQDTEGNYHFGSECSNSQDLFCLLKKIKNNWDLKSYSQKEVHIILEIYESVFHHHAFTGRSGSMYSYEGLGSIYWHMVSKLLLSVQENFSQAAQETKSSEILTQLAEYYYQIRRGIGFNKSPENYGAFPTDPYSHTPLHSGAQQPGMTGQVKEEIITRLQELGIWIENGCIQFHPILLKQKEFLKNNQEFKFINLKGIQQSISLLANQIGFTYCQIPVIYTLKNKGENAIQIEFTDNSIKDSKGNTLSAELSSQVFYRTGKIKKILVDVNNVLT
ncbi:MAG: hypothetical protein MJB14_21200 [Spirochaetes bacterium]|nr:hypothetical protein [Spirochaetota bacterium]